MSKRTGICPICNGTGRLKADKMEQHAKDRGWYGYDKETDTKQCTNCGVRGMYAPPPDGKVELRPDGTPCVHKFSGENIGRCYYRYTCEHCGSSHTIDSGD